MNGDILEKAHNIINGDRQEQYGDPKDFFNHAAIYWTCYLNNWKIKGSDLNGKDVALMMVLFKIARENHQSKIDNLIDAAGYLGIAGDCSEE